jgi:transglutaminase-like putative cysteine protease
LGVILRTVLFVALAFCAATIEATASTEVSKTAVPSWAEDLPIPQPRSERLRQVEDGIYYLVSDTQIKAERTVNTEYDRYVYKVTDRKGLEEAARLDIEFDPTSEAVRLHRARILRNGAYLDQLSSVDIELMRREQELNEGIMDGLKTAHVELDDVRVGDIVEFAYSRETRSRFWPGEFFGEASTAYSEPVGVMRYKLLWPKDRPLTIRNENTTLAPSRKLEGNYAILEWRRSDPDPVRGEDDAPDWYPQWGKVSVSSMSSWGQVAAWALPLYSGDDTLPPRTLRRIEQIEKKYSDPRQRTIEALRLVEDSLRYVSISIGAGSYVPRSPSEVIRSGYGDCKDKSQLLVAVLRRMNIEAHTSLTNLTKGRELANLSPSPTAFDHAIVEVKIGGQTYWLDPTGSLEGGRDLNLQTVDYGWALPIAKDQQRLEKLSSLPSRSPTYVTIERYEIASGPHPSMKLGVTTVYKDADANSMRDTIASKSQSKIEDEYLDFYADMYPGLDLDQPLRIDDDRDHNVIVVREAYKLPAKRFEKDGLLAKFPVKAGSMSDYDDTPNDKRKTPFQLPEHVNKKHVIVLVRPGRALTPPDAAELHSSAFNYRLAVAQSNDTTTLTYSLVGLKDVLQPKDVEDFNAKVSELKDDNYWYLDLSNVMDTSSDEAETHQTLVTAFIAIALLALTIYGLQLGLRADDAYAGRGFFYPVPLAKFCVLNVMTAGLYSLFWTWKCWRWVKAREDGEIAPFWRGVFRVIWYYPLFDRVNRVALADSRIQQVAKISAAGYALWVLGFAVLSVTLKDATITTLASAFSFVWFLPLLSAVNNLNGADSEVLRCNAKVSGLTVAAAAGGLVYWTVIVAGRLGIEIFHL